MTCIPTYIFSCTIQSTSHHSLIPTASCTLAKRSRRLVYVSKAATNDRFSDPARIVKDDFRHLYLYEIFSAAIDGRKRTVELVDIICAQKFVLCTFQSLHLVNGLTVGVHLVGTILLHTAAYHIFVRKSQRGRLPKANRQKARKTFLF